MPRRHIRALCRGTIIWFLALGLTLVAQRPLVAQTVVGTVTEDGTGQPLPGAFVVLVDASGERREGVLSNSDGRYVLRASQPGSYRLVAELIGYGTTETGFVDLGAGATATFDLEVAVQAVSLEGISVRSEARCRPKPGTGPGTSELWEEARKALEVTRWGEQQDALNMRIMQYSRELSPNAHSVREASQRSRTGYYDRSPYVSRPADELDRRGYIQPVAENEYDYFAPDAQVLLSETFLENHCFRVVEPREEADSGLVGLAFEPVRGRDRPDIEGVLWLDEGSAELRRLDFRYSELPFRGVESQHAGGRVEFERLANGMWIIDRWRLRMPLVALQQQPAWRSSRPTMEVVALNEIGAEVQRVVDLSGNVLAQAEGASLYGAVVDSVAGETLAEAVVTLDGDRSTRTAVDGTYRFTDLESGTYQVTFAHPALEVLGLDPQPRTVALESGRATRLVLAIPDPRRIAEAACAEEDGPRAFVYGRVMDPSLTWPIRNAVIRFDPPTGDPQTVTAEPDGVYRFCLSPADEPVRVTAFRPGDVMAALSAGAASRVADAGLSVDAGEATTVRADLTVDAPEARVTATWSNVIHGTVLEEGSETAIEGASITMVDSTGQPVVTVVSDADGKFQLSHPGYGSRFRVQAEHIAYADAVGAVTFGQRDELDVRLLMATRAIELEPIVVVERRRDYLADVGYYSRKERGLGHYVERIEIERHRPVVITDVLRRVPGVKFWGLGGLDSDIRMVGTRRLSGWEGSSFMNTTGTGGQECAPAIYLDGSLARPGGNPDRGYTPLNDIIQPENVEAVEVFRRASEVPARFSGSISQCGVVAIWTIR